MASRATRRAKAKQGGTASESIEKRHQLHPVTYILVIIVTVFSVIAFILLPMYGKSAGSGSIVFGTWSGHDIAYYSGSYFSRVQQSYARQAQESSTTADAKSISYSIWYQAFQMTALHVAELTTAQDSGVEISKDALDEDLLTYSGYLDDNEIGRASCRERV
jgi:hypothetical protein